jgi:hypothetical protein
MTGTRGRNHKMATQKVVTLPKVSKRNTEEAPDTGVSIEEQFGQRKAPEKGRYRLQVDRQTKGSYTTREAAEEASLAIKRAYPILHVAVFDAEEGQSTVITLPEL